MGYPKELKEHAYNILAQRKTSARDRSQYNKQHAQSLIPELIDIQRQLATTGARVSSIIVRGGNVEENIAALKEENLNLQARRAELLMVNGLPLDYLEPKHSCELCQDSGYVGNKICSCHELLLKQLTFEKLSGEVKLASFNFDNFDLNYYPNTKEEGSNYSPRMVMESNYRRAVEYADKFTIYSPSLLLLGKTGLGKTHLSVAIAGKVIEKGYNVLYTSAQNLLFKLEREKFSSVNVTGYDDYMSVVLEADLLIIDDLGAEFSTSFTVSTIYNIINTRQLQGRPTIINSNLDNTKKLQEAYSERFVSRLLGNYTLLTFKGEDIRIKKKYQ